MRQLTELGHHVVRLAEQEHPSGVVYVLMKKMADGAWYSFSHAATPRRLEELLTGPGVGDAIIRVEDGVGEIHLAWKVRGLLVEDGQRQRDDFLRPFSYTRMKADESGNEGV